MHERDACMEPSVINCMLASKLQHAVEFFVSFQFSQPFLCNLAYLSKSFLYACMVNKVLIFFLLKSGYLWENFVLGLIHV